jgi:carbohydrate-binding DOMON domain-containing protein
MIMAHMVCVHTHTHTQTHTHTHTHTHTQIQVIYIQDCTHTHTNIKHKCMLAHEPAFEVMMCCQVVPKLVAIEYKESPVTLTLSHT